ncbi:MAG: PorT family protein [Bacteroidales bacterium]|nr:PorT family protein [Bacteroidales bacterium]
MIHSNPKFKFQKEIKFFITSLIILVNITVCLSQENFSPGYILSLSGDTLKGEILDQGDINNAKTVIFRENENTNEQTFTPTDISAFYISNGKYFESKIFNFYQDIPIITLLKIVNTSWETENRSAYEIKRDTAFLRVVVKGKAQVYVNISKGGRKMYFVETPSGGFKHLRHNKTYDARKNGNIKFKTKTSIKDTLDLLVSNCPENLLIEKRKKIYLTDLIDLFTDYNTCIGSKSEIIQPRLKVKIKFGLNLGMNNTNVLPRGEKNQIIENYTFKNKQGIMVGGLVDWYFNSVKENWAIETEISYNQKGANPKDDYFYHYYPYSDESFDTMKVKLNFEYIDFGFYAKYFINSNKHVIRPYINMGMIIGFQINKKDPILISKNGGEFKDYYHDDYLPETEVGVAGKIGMLFMTDKRIGVYGEFRTSYTELLNTVRLGKFTNTLYNFTLGLYL